MAQTPKTKSLESGDVFIREDLSREYDSESVFVANVGGTHIFYPPGTPFTGTAQTATDAGNTGTDQFVLEGIWVPPGGWKVAMMKRPAGVVINANALPGAAAPGGPGNVVNGITYTTAALVTAAQRLGFVVRYEPVRWASQSM